MMVTVVVITSLVSRVMRMTDDKDMATRTKLRVLEKTVSTGRDDQMIKISAKQPRPKPPSPLNPKLPEP